MRRLLGQGHERLLALGRSSPGPSGLGLAFPVGFLVFLCLSVALAAHAQEQPGESDLLYPDPDPTTGELTAEQVEFGTAEIPTDPAEEAEGEAGQAEEEFSDIEEIMITSQRREQREEDATASAVAFSSMEIEAQRFMDLRDVSQVTPNLEIKSVFSASNPTLFIRGVGLNDFNANSASAVAVYNDEIYMNSPAGQLGQIFDLGEIAVLRGPQGTLYGRNASAGVIRLISRKPRMGEYEVNLSGSYGTFNLGEFQGGMTIPLYSDVLAWRGAFTFIRRDGYVENLCGGFDERQFNSAVIPTPGPLLPGGLGTTTTPFACGPPGGAGTAFSPGPREFIPANLPVWTNNRHNWAGRSTLRLVLDESEWLLNFHGGQNDSLASQFQHVGTRAGNWGGYDNFNYLDASNDIYKGQYNLQDAEVVTLFGGYLQGDIDLLGDHDLRVVTGYDRSERNVYQDFDASPLTNAHADNASQAWQVTQEIRLLSDYSGRFQWQTGAFFLYENLVNHTEFLTQGGETRFFQDYLQETYSLSGFIHGTYELGDDLVLDTGIRYNWEQKQFNAKADYAPGDGFASLPTLDIRDRRDFQGLSGNVTLNWQIVAEVSSYVKYSHGFKGGHFNGGTVTSRGVKPPAEPEKVDSFEVGLKGSWLENRIMFGAAAFYYDYKDLQVFQLQNTGISAPPINVLINANNARVAGVEADFALRPVDDLSIRGAFGWLDSRYLDFQDTVFIRATSPDGSQVYETELTQDYTGNRLVASPTISASGTVDYQIHLGRYGTLEPRYDFSYKGGTYFDPTEGRGIYGEFPDYSIGQAAYWLHNIRLAWRSENGLVEIAGWVRNIADQEYKVDTFDLTQGFGIALEVWGQPRTAGVTLSVSY